MGISLKKTFDYLAAPSPVVDPYGQNPHSKNTLSRLASRPDFIIPAGLTALMITGSALALSPKETFIVAAQSAMVIALYAGKRISNDRLYAQTETQFYLDRTEKGNFLKPVSPPVKRELIFKQNFSKDQVFLVAKFTAPFLGATAIMAPLAIPAGVIATASYLTYHAASHWRASRALSGDWRVLETIPPHKQDQRATEIDKIAAPAAP